MKFVLKSIKLPRKYGFGEKNNVENILGPKKPEKITFFLKISKSKSRKNLNFTKGTTRTYYLYSQKKV
jgi:hypothetical protein